MKYNFVRLLAFALITLLPAHSFAQTALTSLHGIVFDPQGAVIPAATITITQPDTGFTQTHASGNHGEFIFPQIPPGHYTITVSATGFAEKRQVAEFLVNQPGTVNFNMSITADTTVEVNSTAALLNSTDATIGTPFNTEQIQSLPFEGTNIMDLLSLQAGVVFTGDVNQNSNTDTRAGSVNGARSDQNNITLDGLDNNVATKGFAFQGALRATRDSLEEFRVVTTNSNADSGRSSGAQVSLVTRSGTNKYHGSLYYYYRPTNTVAND